MLCENGAHSTILFPGFDPEVNTINYGYSVFKSNDYKNALNDAVRCKKMGIPIADADIANLQNLAR